MLSGNRESRYEPWGSSIPGAWFSSWYVVSIYTGHIAQSPQSGPKWSPAFKMEPVLSVSSFSISPSNEYSRLTSFRMDWFDLLALSRVFANTTVQKHQFFGAQLSL